MGKLWLHIQLVLAERPELPYMAFVRRMFDVVQWLVVASAIKYLARKTHSSSLDLIALFLQSSLVLYIGLDIVRRLPFNYFDYKKRMVYDIAMTILALAFSFGLTAKLMHWTNLIIDTLQKGQG